jgi:hypothetical protein
MDLIDLHHNDPQDAERLGCTYAREIWLILIKMTAAALLKMLLSK